jgi:pimeloyl-ACP methyl ester carboxylesterase
VPQAGNLGAALTLGVALAAAGGPGCWGSPDRVAHWLLAPARHRPHSSPRESGLPEEDFSVEVETDVTLQGWLVRATGGGRRRGLLVYLHGVSDSRGTGAGVAWRFAPRGWDVAAYDARAHGDSGGQYCTYGFWERHDVSRVLDALAARGVVPSPTVLFGSSMGAAVALQAAPDDARVRGVIAQSPFADLWTGADENRPFTMSRAALWAGLARAEELARFRADEVSAVEAARRLAVPLLLVHGARDRKLSPEHSRRILGAAAGPKRLVVIENAGHDDVLAAPAAWTEIERFLDQLAPSPN